MGSYLLRQTLIVMPITLLGAVTLIFLIIHLIPGDPVVGILGDLYTEEAYLAMQARLGLDQPLHVQYLNYLWGLINLDMGVSFQNRRPVFQNIASQFPYTMHLAVASLFVAILVALPAGIIAAAKRNRWPDYLSMLIALLAICTPLYVVGIILLLVFSLYLGWLPSFGVGESGNIASILAHLTLPAITQGATLAALLARVTRATFLDVLSQDYVRTARSKGLREWWVLLRHALPNTLIPLITIVGMNVATLLGGTVIIETVFSRQGVGRLLISAILSRDYPQIQGTLLVFIFITISANLIVDILYTLADPRIKYS